MSDIDPLYPFLEAMDLDPRSERRRVWVDDEGGDGQYEDEEEDEDEEDDEYEYEDDDNDKYEGEDE